MFLDGFSIAALYMLEVERLKKLRSRLENAQARILARSHLLITGGGVVSFSSDFGPFSDFENWDFPVVVCGKPRFLK